MRYLEETAAFDGRLIKNTNTGADQADTFFYFFILFLFLWPVDQKYKQEQTRRTHGNSKTNSKPNFFIPHIQLNKENKNLQKQYC